MPSGIRFRSRQIDRSAAAATARFDPLRQAAAETAAAPREPTAATPSCEDGLAKETLLAQAAVKETAAPTALAPGKHTIVYEFISDEAKPGTGGKSNIIINGKNAAHGKIPKTQPFAFSADEGADLGEDGETSVSPDYKQGTTSSRARFRK